MLKVYDKSMNLRLCFSGLNIRYCEDVHESYLYTISDQITRPYQIGTEENDFDGEKAKDFTFSAPGLYVYDIKKLFQGKVEKYKLAKAIGGICNTIDNSRFSERFSFI